MKCTFKSATGYDCTGCGSQRALHYLTHFQIGKALHYNALFVIAFPYLSLMFVYVLRTYLTGKSAPDILTGKWAGQLILIGVILFTIIRNFPWFRL